MPNLGNVGERRLPTCPYFIGIQGVSLNVPQRSPTFPMGILMTFPTPL
jgi:hypothetical protein